MRIGHGIGGRYDTGQGGDIGDLLVYLVIHVAYQLLAGIDDGRDVHVTERFYSPGIFGLTC